MAEHTQPLMSSALPAHHPSPQFFFFYLVPFIYRKNFKTTPLNPQFYFTTPSPSPSKKKNFNFRVWKLWLSEMNDVMIV